jgi:hypothetical protein
MPQIDIYLDTDLTILILAVSSLLGLAAAVAMRKSEGSPIHALCIWMFHGCLLAVGTTAILFIQVPSGLGLLAPITLGAMIVGTTWDFRTSPTSPTQ